MPRRATELAEALATGPAWALGRTKRLIRAAWSASREDSARDEAAPIARAVATDEAQALIHSFTAR